MSIAFVILAAVGLLFIVLNERFAFGVPESWLTIQTGLWFGGVITELFFHELVLAVSILSVSASAGITGFLLLWFGGGPRRFTKAIFPGLKS